MKTTRKFLLGSIVISSFGAAALFANSGAVSTHLSKAGAHSAAGSREVAAAGAEAGSAAVKAGATVAAVPVYLSGAALANAGSATAAVGVSLHAAGQSTAEGATALWDYANENAGPRPALDREQGVPPAAVERKLQDPSPAVALKKCRS